MSGRRQLLTVLWLLPAVLSLPAALLLPVSALAQTGVSNDRVSLPDGPGSREGLGDDVTVTGNMGTMHWSYTLEVPQGFEGVTPDLDLAYDSGGGQSPVGLGWTLAAPSIERLTYKGLPRYDASDRMGASGDELVRVGTGSPATYRARFEGGFVRYTWFDPGSGGYWRAEYPDGRVGWFGADETGASVPSARVDGPAGTFRYHLVVMTDAVGHALRVSYTKDGATSLLSAMRWVFDAAGVAKDGVQLTYEPRADASGEEVVSDATPGFDLRLTQRLASVVVTSSGVPIRRYALGYDDYAASGGVTRLTRIARYGVQDGLYPAVMSLHYSQSLAGGLTGPSVTHLGATGVPMTTGRATLIDLDGDGLSDLLTTPADGAHRVFRNRMDASGQQSFEAALTSALPGTNAFVLGTGRVQTLDVDGNGLADLLDTKSGKWLRNDGSGDWAGVESLVPSGPDVESDFDPSADQGLGTIRYMDYDNDRRIDLIKTPGKDSLLVYRNNGPSGFTIDPDVEPIGETFQGGVLELDDMNGDGLLDPVMILPGVVKYRVHLGRGHFGPWTTIEPAPVTADTQAFAQMEDMNGDGLADLVLVRSDTVDVALNKNGEGFFDVITVTGADVPGGALPVRAADTTVLLADMNGNGSSDVVWVSATGDVSFLELFPVRPNLLDRIDNGLGQLTEVTYGSAVAHAAASTAPWTHRPPNAVLVVDRVDITDGASGVHDITDYDYKDGFYSAEEKQFRGFVTVTADTLGDVSEEAGRRVETYDVGLTDPLRRALRVGEDSSSGERLIERRATTYAECPVAETEGAAAPIRFFCRTAEERTELEGEADGPRMRTEWTYDGYGNVTQVSELGVVARPGGCEPCVDDGLFGAPCGLDCIGDERLTQVEFAAHGERWVISAPAVQRVRATASGEASERRFYYDGPAFVGLPAGQVTSGLVTRVTDRVSWTPDVVVESTRVRRDANGNVVESLDPLAALGSDDHRVRDTYDPLGLHVISSEVRLGGGIGLRTDLTYEPLFDQVAEATAPMRTVDGVPTSPKRSTFFGYDEFGRLDRRVDPGADTLTAPTEQYVYELASPVSRIISRSRSVAGGAVDTEAITCVDSRGRTLATRRRVASGSDAQYAVTGLSILSRGGLPVRQYHPYASSGAACELAPPAGVLHEDFRYDALGRALQTTLPDAAEQTTASMTRTEYAPLLVRAFDAEDTAAAGPFAGTPEVRAFDGLGRVVALTRAVDAGQSATTTVRYDGQGQVAAVIDAAGNVRAQVYDLLGRAIEVSDPNLGGSSTTEFDAAGHPVVHTDARGRVTALTYDGAGRLVERAEPGHAAETRTRWTWDHCDGCVGGDGLVVAVEFPGPGGTVARRTWDFDARGQVAASRVEVDGIGYRTEVERDNLGRVTRTRYPNGQALDRTYDGVGRLRSVGGVVDAVDYDETLQPVRIAFADGTADLSQWDSLRRIRSRATVDNAGVVLSGAEVARDRVGNAVNVTSLGVAPGALDHSAALQHDAAYRTTAATLGQGGSARSLAWSFDALDNVVSATASEPAWSSGALLYEAGPNAVTRFGETAVSYDLAGEVVTRGASTFDWDHLGRLQEAQTPAGAVTYGYEPSGRPLWRDADGSRVVWASAEVEDRDGVLTLRPLVLGDRAARIEDPTFGAGTLSDVAPVDAPDAAITAGDAWVSRAASAGFIGVDGSLTPPRRLLHAAVARLLSETGPATTLLHADAFGNVALATDGVVLGEQTFTPTGLPRERTGYVDAYGFGGAERDPLTGLLRFRYRWLDPVTARWLSPDPLFAVIDSGKLAFGTEATADYAYVGNAFGSRCDPTGLVSLGLFGKKGGGSGKVELPGGEVEAGASHEPSAHEKAEGEKQQVNAQYRQKLRSAMVRASKAYKASWDADKNDVDPDRHAAAMAKAEHLDRKIGRAMYRATRKEQRINRKYGLAHYRPDRAEYERGKVLSALSAGEVREQFGGGGADGGDQGESGPRVYGITENTGGGVDERRYSIGPDIGGDDNVPGYVKSTH